MALKKAFLLRRSSARKALTGAPDTWVTNATDPDEDEAAVWGEMFILSEKDAGAADDATVEEVR